MKKILLILSILGIFSTSVFSQEYRSFKDAILLFQNPIAFKKWSLRYLDVFMSIQKQKNVNQSELAEGNSLLNLPGTNFLARWKSSHLNGMIDSSGDYFGSSCYDASGMLNGGGKGKNIVDSLIENDVYVFKRKYGEINFSQISEIGDLGISTSKNWETVFQTLDLMYCQMTPDDYRRLALVLFFTIDSQTWNQQHFKYLSRQQRFFAKLDAFFYLIQSNSYNLSVDDLISYYLRYYKQVNGSQNQLAQKFGYLLFHENYTDILNFLRTNPRINNLIKFIDNIQPTDETERKIDNMIFSR